jgi:hypothetical protein
MAAEKYQPLKEFVAEGGGARLRFHRGVRDRLVEIAVEEFPIDAPEDKIKEVLVARMRRRVSQESGSVVAIILLNVLCSFVANLVWDWWKKRHANVALMAGWQREAARAKES